MNKEYYLKNKDKILQKHKEYSLKNKDKILQKKKEYYLKNKDKISQHKKEYNKRPEVKLRKQEYLKKYHEENKEYFKEQNKIKWERIKNDDKLLKKNRDYLRAYSHLPKQKEKRKKRAKREWQITKNIPSILAEKNRRINEWRATPSGIYTSLKNRGRKDFNLNKDEFIRWYEKQPKKCSYCQLTMEQINKLPPPYDRKNGLVKFSIDRKDNSIGYTIKNIALCCFTCNTIKNNFLNYKDMVKIGRDILIPKFKKILKI